MNKTITNMQFAEICVKRAQQNPPAVIDFEMLKIKTGKEDILDFMRCLKKCGAKDVALRIDFFANIFNFKIDM